MYIFSSLLGSLFSDFMKRKPEAVEEIAMKLDMEKTLAAKNWRHFARKLNIEERFIECLRWYGYFSPTLKVFDSLEGTKPDFTVGTLKQVFKDIGRNDLKKLLDKGIVSKPCFFFDLQTY